MLSFDEFQQYVERTLPNFLPEKLSGAEISIREVTKNNGRELHGLTVLPQNTNIAPTIYLEGAYNEYTDGKDLDLVVSNVARIAAENATPPQELENIGKDFLNFDYVKNRIVMMVVNTEKNKDLLANTPHQNREDLSIVYKVMLDNNQDEMATILIRDEHMKTWGVGMDEIHEIAMENTRNLLPVTVQSMNDIMKEMLGNEGMPDDMMQMMFEEMPIDQQMFVITNTAKMNGAACMFYEDVLANLSEKIGSDLYILPSSIHEVIAISANMGSPEELANMVKEVNGGQVSLEEQLSNHVYRYDANARTLSLADTSMEMLESKVSESVEAYEAKSETQAEGNRPRHHR